MRIEKALQLAVELSEEAASLKHQRMQEVGIRSHMDTVASSIETRQASKRAREESAHGNGHDALPLKSITFHGCTRVKRLNGFLAHIDSKGFERSNHQCRFHDAFMKACGRTLYREEWGVHRTEIMRTNGWHTDKSEVMISTPRRFGKTFRCA